MNSPKFTKEFMHIKKLKREKSSLVDYDYTVLAALEENYIKTRAERKKKRQSALD